MKEIIEILSKEFKEHSKPLKGRYTKNDMMSLQMIGIPLMAAIWLSDYERDMPSEYAETHTEHPAERTTAAPATGKSPY